MIKKIIQFIILSNFFSFNAAPNELSCSLAGTTILHINGAFTSNNDQSKSSKRINEILDSKKKYFDQKEQSVEPIRIATQGWVHDKLSYYMMKYGDKYGSEAEEAAWIQYGVSELGYNLHGDIGKIAQAIDFAAIKSVKEVGLIGSAKSIIKSNIKDKFSALTNLSGQGVSMVTKDSGQALIEALTSQETYDSSTRTGKYISMIGIVDLDLISIKNALNFISILAIEESWNTSIDNQRDSILASKWAVDKNIKNISTELKKKLDLNKKIIINAHAEGNQLASRAIAQIKQDPNYYTKVKKYISILATSPTSEEYHGKYVYMKNDHDNRLFDLDIPANFVLIPNFFTYSNAAGASYSSYSANNFLDFYISPVNKAKRINSINKVPIRDFYTEDLRKAAELLENSCGDPNITLNSPNEGVEISNIYPKSLTWKTDMPLNGRTITINIKDATIYAYNSTSSFTWGIYKREFDSGLNEYTDTIVEEGAGDQIVRHVEWSDLVANKLNYILKIHTTNSLGIESSEEIAFNIVFTPACQNVRLVFGVREQDNSGLNGVLFDCGNRHSCSELGASVVFEPPQADLIYFPYYTHNNKQYVYQFWQRDFPGSMDSQMMITGVFPPETGGKTYDAKICQKSLSDENITFKQINTFEQTCIWDPSRADCK